MDMEDRLEAIEIAEELQDSLASLLPQIQLALTAANEAVAALNSSKEVSDADLQTLKNTDWKALEIWMFDARSQVIRLDATIHPQN